MRSTISLSVAFFLLAACGGGGGGSSVSMEPVPPPQTPINPNLPTDEPSVPMEPVSSPQAPIDLQLPIISAGQQRVFLFFGDTYLKTSEYREFDLSFSDQSERTGAERLAFNCEGTSCRPDGTLDISLVMGDRALDSSRTHYRVLSYSAEQVSGLNTEQWIYERKTPYDDGSVTVSTTPRTQTYGIWGDRGYALVQVANGPYRGVRKSDNASFDGTVAAIIPSIRTRFISGSAPGGTGSATWEGPAEAVAIETYTRHRGTATLTIPDLSNPELRSQSLQTMRRSENQPGTR